VTRKLTLADRLDQKLFDAIYSRNLIYNTCWEDPAVDREALRIGAGDTMLVITSAGCNVLDYALAAPRRIHAVDANPRQTALLELKLAAIRCLDYGDFFALFGAGRHRRARELYHDALRAELEGFSREFWDRRIGWFVPGQGPNTFYHFGLAGRFARAVRTYFELRPRLRDGVRALFASRDLAEQRSVYDERVHPLLWSRGMNWTLSRQTTMSVLGVPHPQRKEVERQHAGGVAGFIRDCVEYVFRQLPAWSNYFWAVYVFGRYEPGCCPQYLERESFLALKHGLAASIRCHTTTVTDFLESGDAPISRFVLLDHMDWMSSYFPAELAREWDAILARATPDARIIFRSAHARPGYLDRLLVGPERRELREVFTFHDALAARLARHDRVHTYAGFHVATVAR